LQGNPGGVKTIKSMSMSLHIRGNV